jgi:hypothetical protein
MGLDSAKHFPIERVSSPERPRPQRDSKQRTEEIVTMKNEIKLTLLSAALAVFALPAVAQSTDTSAQGSATPAAPANGQVTGKTIQQRKENQQDRIAQGVASGELNAKETTNLEKKEAAINQEERDMRKLDNGKLTAADKATINQQQNQLSKQIYADKHNAATQNTDPKSEVGKRAENQQDRIAQGVKSGQLTAGEAAHLERNEAKINQQIAADRKANGGKLTPEERKQINKEQNRESRQIYRAKHNNKHQ